MQSKGSPARKRQRAIQKASARNKKDASARKQITAQVFPDFRRDSRRLSAFIRIYSFFARK
ncbi:MAG: hypothetical protein J6Q17_08100 [Clostridia bacterium]|nr:hypothetical protein [Clostridia bacterium]